MRKKPLKNQTFSHKLDKISENLLYLLSIDSNLSSRDLAEKLNITRRKAELRVNKLYSEEYIKPLLIINHSQLLKATILIKLTHFDLSILNSIKEIKQLVKLKETLGLYDLSILVQVKNQKELDEIIAKLNELFSSAIQNIEVVYHEKEDTLGYKSFCSDLTLLENYKEIKTENFQLSEDDLTVLNVLKENLNFNYEQLSRETAFCYEKLKKIIQNLLSNGIIRFSVDPNYSKLGLEFHNVLVRINTAKKESFEKNILAHPRVHWMKKSKGRWDYILSVASRDMNEFIDVTRQIRTENKDSILDFASLDSKISVMRRN